MAHVTDAARVAETSASTGTGDIVLGGAYDASHRTVASIPGIANGDTGEFMVKAANGAWQRMIATYNSGANSLTRGTLIESSTGANVNFTAALVVYLISGAVGRVIRSPRTANTQLALSDRGTWVDITSGSFTQTFAAAATLGAGWWCYLGNSGTGDVTLDPNSTETIDGLTSFVMYPGEVRLVQCDGSAFRSIVLESFSRTFTSTSTFTKPPGYSYFAGLLWGGGASGAFATASNCSGGGGAACVPFQVPASAVGATETITIAAAAAGVTVAGSGVAGGTSSLGSLVYAYGGAPGVQSAGAAGGGGGGALSAASGAVGGDPDGAIAGAGNAGFGGSGGGATSTSTKPKKSIYGGAGGGSVNNTGPVSGQGGDAVYGGAGGGAASSADAAVGGLSQFGGAGGDGHLNANGGDGQAPGGGGGASRGGTTSGAGARGECQIWGVA